MKRTTSKLCTAVLVGVCALAAGCFSSRNADQALTPSETVDARSVVIGADCSLPCWQGIIPGQSNDRELMALLRSLDSVDGNSIHRESSVEMPGYEVIEWYNTSNTSYGHRDGVAYLNQSKVVMQMRIYPSSSVTTQEMLDLADSPDYYYTSLDARPYTYFVRIIWLSEGVEATYRDIRAARRGHPIDGNSRVGYITYFAPVSSLKEYLVTYDGETDLSVLMRMTGFEKWQGIDQMRPDTTGPTPYP